MAVVLAWDLGVLSSETLCLLTAIGKLTLFSKTDWKLTSFWKPSLLSSLLLRSVLCHRCNWDLWNQRSVLCLCHVSVSSVSSYWGQHGLCRESRDSEIWHESGTTPEFSDSFWLSFVTLGLLLYSRGLSSSVLASSLSCFPLVLSRSGQRAPLTSKSTTKFILWVPPFTVVSVLICQMGIIIGPSSPNSCKNEMRSGMFTGVGTGQVVTGTFSCFSQNPFQPLSNLAFGTAESRKLNTMLLKLPSAWILFVT